MLPCGSQPTSVGRHEDVLLRRRIRAGRCDDRPVNGRRPAADHHQHFALRAELGHQVRAFIDGPDVVFLVDADRVGELEPVVTLADLLREVAVLVELEQACRVAPVVDVDVAFRVGGDGDRLAEVFPRWKLEKVRDGGDRDVRDACNRGFRLSERGIRGGQDDRSADGSKTSFHWDASAGSLHQVHRGFNQIRIAYQRPSGANDARVRGHSSYWIPYPR